MHGNSTNQLETLPGPRGYCMAVESTQGPKTTVTSKHSCNNFPFQVFKTSWENKCNPCTAARNTLEKAIICSIWTEKHLLKKEQAMKIHPTIHKSPGYSQGGGKESCFTAWVGAASSGMHNGQARPSPLKQDQTAFVSLLNTWFAVRTKPLGCRRVSLTDPG